MTSCALVPASTPSRSHQRLTPPGNPTVAAFWPAAWPSCCPRVLGLPSCFAYMLHSHECQPGLQNDVRLRGAEIACGFSAARQIANTKTVALINKVFRHGSGDDGVGIKTQQARSGALHGP